MKKFAIILLLPLQIKGGYIENKQINQEFIQQSPLSELERLNESIEWHKHNHSIVIDLTARKKRLLKRMES